MLQKVIGGEMEIAHDAPVRCLLSPEDIAGLGTAYSSGRSALLAILRHISGRGVRRVFLPDYLCASVVETVRFAGLAYEFYNLDASLMPAAGLAERTSDSDAVLLINYFGMQDHSATVRHLRSAGNAVIIEDDVQAFYSYLNPKTDNADYRFTSLRKWFPVPDGGLAMASDGTALPAFSRENLFWVYKYSGLLLKGAGSGGDDSLFLDILRKGEQMIDSEIECAVSDCTIRLLAGVDIAAAAQKRRTNAASLQEGLRNIGITPLLQQSGGDVPFFIPVCLANRDEVRAKMFENNIFCPVHWPLEGLPLQTGARLEAHELSLIADQRYSETDMARILEILSKYARQ